MDSATFYQLYILFKDNAILIIYGCYNFSIFAYELIDNKIQKINEFPEKFKSNGEYAFIEFTYIPSLNKIYFGYKNEIGENLVCNLEFFEYEYISEEIKNEQLNKISAEQQYTIDEFKVLFNEENLQK